MMMSDTLTLYITHAYETTGDEKALPKVCTEVLKLSFSNGTFHLIENGKVLPLKDDDRFNLGALSISAELPKQADISLPPEVSKASPSSHAALDPTLERLRNLSASMPEPWVPQASSNDPLSFLQAPFLPQLRTYSNDNQLPLAAATPANDKLNMLDQHFKAPQGIEQHNYNNASKHELTPQSFEQGNILRDLGLL